MKKLLLASTALVMTAGVASAEVTLSGEALMGLFYDGDDARMVTEMGITFTMSGETDGGLAFGAEFDAEDAGDAADGNAGSVFISGEFGKLSMGDVDSAADAIVGNIDGVGLTGLEEDAAYLGNNETPGALYEYSIDGFSVALGIDSFEAGRVISAGVGYTYEGFTVGVGYEKEDGGLQHGIVSAAYSMEGITAKAIYGRSDGNDQYGASLSGSFDATTVTAYGFRNFDEETSFGVGAAYDLGGGASIEGGVVRQFDEETVADFGLSFKF